MDRWLREEVVEVLPGIVTLLTLAAAAVGALLAGGVLERWFGEEQQGAG